MIDTEPKQELTSKAISKTPSPTSTLPKLPYPILSRYGQARGQNPKDFANSMPAPTQGPRSHSYRTFDSFYENQLIRAQMDTNFIIQNDFFGDLPERFSFGYFSDPSQCFGARAFVSFGRHRPPAIIIVCYVMEDAQIQFSTKHVSTTQASSPGLVKKFRMRFVSDPSEVAGPGVAALIEDPKWDGYDNLSSPELPDHVRAALQGAEQDREDETMKTTIWVLSWKPKARSLKVSMTLHCLIA